MKGELNGGWVKSVVLLKNEHGAFLFHRLQSIQTVCILENFQNNLC